MFKGVIKGNTRRILIDLLKERKRDTYFVGCSGAFTIENLILRNMNAKRIVSSDVSIFTNAIGFYLDGQDFDIDIATSGLAFLKDYLDQGLVYKTAVVLFLQDLADWVVCNNKHQIRMMQNYMKEYDGVIQSKVERLEEHKELLEKSGVEFTYIPQDVVDFVERVEPDSIFMSFPPFWVGGYEKLYEFIDETLVSEKLRPPYKMFDEDSLRLMVDTLKGSGGDFIIGTNRGKLFHDQDGVEIVAYDYFSQNELVHFVTNFKTESRFAHQDNHFISSTYGVELGGKEEFENLSLDDDLDIREIPLDLFDSIRLSRLSENIKNPAAPLTKFGVFINDKLVGIFGIDVQSMKIASDSFYLMSDLPIVNYFDSAKLIAALATSRGVREFLKGKYLVDYPTIRTTAFTDKPVSMKYRNFWKVDNRNKKKDFINYIADMGKYHKNDIIQKWLSVRKRRES